MRSAQCVMTSSPMASWSSWTTQGCPQSDRLQRRHVLRHTHPIKQAALEDSPVIFAFNLLWLNGADFRARPLLERKTALHRLLPANRRVCYARHMNDSSAQIGQLAI